MKMINKKLFLVTILLITGILINFAYAQQTSKGPRWETTCQNNICQTTIYSYEKYFFRNNVWEEIDENFYDCSQGQNIRFCTKDYHFNVTADSTGLVSAFLNNNLLIQRLYTFLNYNLSFNPNVNGSVITYENIIPGYVNVRYQYLPKKLKKEIIIKQRIPIQQNFSIIFTKSGNANFIILDSIICDASTYCENINHTINENQIIIHVPISFLNNPNTTYPVVIDPTLELNDSYISWNGRVLKSTIGTCTIAPCYTRTNNPSSISLGKISDKDVGKGDIDWDLTPILDNSSIMNATLSVFVETTTSSNFVNITHMEGNSSTYPDNYDNCQGNCNFYNDMGNGTLYSDNNTLSGTNFYLNLSFNSQGILNIQNSLVNNTFSTGINTDVSTKTITISARDNTNTTRRPKLIIIYEINSSEGNRAIEIGINNSLPNNPITSNQQIYLVNTSGQHFLGKFDKATILGNQTWAFNYIALGESFTNIPSLFKVLNIWENQSLSFNEIVNQVSIFINSTRY